MSSRAYDTDTLKILGIASDILTLSFGYSPERATALMEEFCAQFGEDYDEDVIHHESSYRIAAAAHFLISLRGRREELGSWLETSGHGHTPPEALEYFRLKYFGR